MANKFFLIKNQGAGHAVDIRFQDRVLCLIEWDKETNQLKIMFYPHEPPKNCSAFLVEDFLKALKQAKNIILQSLDKDCA